MRSPGKDGQGWLVPKIALEFTKNQRVGLGIFLGKPPVTHDSFFSCSRTTLLVQLTFEGSRGPSYLPGEHLGIFPGNQTALVQGILERVVDCPTPHQTVCLEVLDESGEFLGPNLCFPQSHPSGLGLS